MLMLLLLLHKQQGLLRNNEEDEEVEVMSCEEAKPKSKLVRQSTTAVQSVTDLPASA